MDVARDDPAGEGGVVMLINLGGRADQKEERGIMKSTGYKAESQARLRLAFPHCVLSRLRIMTWLLDNRRLIRKRVDQK